uniref:NADH dehydrogenase [ubiquinone] 1 subunit C1, mitochondrial isoform X1 n=1 Tax=Monopterus albus TaxID=43700 RepID=UPI0009B2E680|nr:NADH dehydrogenase [ubiquinone] 1 subunit C1, mitochondrial isoform X1 [Monopterus albus]
MCFSSGSSRSLSLRLKVSNDKMHMLLDKLSHLSSGCRSLFRGSKPDTANPNWFRVGLAFGTSVFIWGLLFRQHSRDVHEYKVRNGLE